jgi:hypothetical protein
LAYRISSETFALSADEALRRKARDGERLMATATEAGVPAPSGRLLNPSRFANQNPTVQEILISQIDEAGGLGAIADDRKNKLAQTYFRDKAGQMFDSPMNNGMA